eukprot:CAMPEP_0195291714 /NCGR_PEP_ID=MMETSP0707-20130614/8117_1 /TAXON_ID=33640 /ORGANISM="Asterionellopsis glacialis, Strain CCMP134" /LENGTH=183 /DNA_ID=CAMNT_0040352055 /DNA_START=143 /DNA_END=694 /DNA_ORIENTATION=+
MVDDRSTSKTSAESNPEDVLICQSEKGEGLIDFNMLMKNLNKTKSMRNVKIPKHDVVMELCCPFQDCMCNANESAALGKKGQGSKDSKNQSGGDYSHDGKVDDDDKSETSLELTTVIPRRMSMVSQISMHSVDFDHVPAVCCPFEDCVCMSGGVVPYSDLGSSDHLRRVCRESKFEQTHVTLG